MEEINFGSRNSADRDVALISLHSDATEYLEGLNPLVRPIQCYILDGPWIGGKRGGYFYYLEKFRGEEEEKIKSLVNLATKIDSKYSNIEQVYVYPQSSFRKIGGNLLENIQGLEDTLFFPLSEIMFKSFIQTPGKDDLLFDFRETEKHKRIIEKSLRFSSY